MYRYIGAAHDLSISRPLFVVLSFRALTYFRVLKQERDSQLLPALYWRDSPSRGTRLTRTCTSRTIHVHLQSLIHVTCTSSYLDLCREKQLSKLSFWIGKVYTCIIHRTFLMFLHVYTPYEPRRSLLLQVCGLSAIDIGEEFFRVNSELLHWEVRWHAACLTSSMICFAQRYATCSTVIHDVRAFRCGVLSCDDISFSKRY